MLRQAQHERGGVVLHLFCHPQTPCGAIRFFDVVVAVDQNAVTLEYRIDGRIEEIVLPTQRDAPQRRDELWRTTCFEMFVAGEGPQYREFNFAPSSDYAVYDFAAYREEMRAGDVRPKIETVRQSDRFELIATLSPFALSLSKDGLLPRSQDDASTSSARTEEGVRLGLCAVIEARDGSKSYWALSHAPGPPDFHNRDCFTATLPAPERP